jgi:hypothetical protein
MAKNLHEISCLACCNDMMVDAGVETGICGDCMGKLVGAPVQRTAAAGTVKVPKLTKKGVPRKRRGEGVAYKPSGFPRGWHFKLYYQHTDGKQYSKGKEITKPADIKRCKELQSNRDKAKAV